MNKLFFRWYNEVLEQEFNQDKVLLDFELNATYGWVLPTGKGRQATLSAISYAAEGAEEIINNNLNVGEGLKQ